MPFFSEQNVMFGGSQASPRDVHAFNYVKLHGSADWWVFPDDGTGSSLQRGLPSAELTGAQRRLRGLRQPFIVPPTAQKGGYFGSALTQYLWTAAADAVGAAKEVTLLGYSLPLTDHSSASLLSERLAHSDAVVVVADLDPVPVVERLVAVGCEKSRLEVFGGENPIKDFVQSRGERAARVFAERLHQELIGASQLALGWGPQWRSVVCRAWLEDRGQTLVLEGTRSGEATLVRSDAVLGEGQESVRALSVAELPRGAAAVSLVMLQVGNQRWPAIGRIRGMVSPAPDNDDDWFTMYPFGAPPASDQSG